MTSSTEPNQRTGGLGDVVPQAPQKKDEPEEKWVTVASHPGYVRSTKTGAIKEKE